jgi:hypothetical protein
MAIDTVKMAKLFEGLPKLNLNREEVLKLNDWTIDELRRIDRQQSFKFRRGERVEWDSFRRPGVTIRGSVITVNERTCTLQPDDGGPRWRVGFSHLRKAA